MKFHFTRKGQVSTSVRSRGSD